MHPRAANSLRTTNPIMGGTKQGLLSRQVRSLTDKWHFHFSVHSISAKLLQGMD